MSRESRWLSRVRICSVRWLDGGSSTGDPCQARSYHGVNGIDGQVVAAAAGFRR